MQDMKKPALGGLVVLLGNRSVEQKPESLGFVFMPVVEGADWDLRYLG